MKDQPPVERSLKAHLQDAVSTWFRANAREFPWRETKDPFHILIAEVLLRQTQASRVVEPYIALTKRFPDPTTLARADLDNLRNWFNPLGLVQRADHLITASKQISDHYDGEVPTDLNSLTKLPGIGTYSARAILCLAFGEPVPMIDESSGRLLRRLLGLNSTSPAYSDRQLREIAASLMPEDRPREFNLALLDIAAAVCKPKNPRCSSCPLSEMCDYAGLNEA